MPSEYERNANASRKLKKRPKNHKLDEILGFFLKICRAGFGNLRKKFKDGTEHEPPDESGGS
jgi:hypothetical protein